MVKEPTQYYQGLYFVSKRGVKRAKKKMTAGKSLIHLPCMKNQKSISPYLSISFIKMNAIRKPERTKNKSTPISPFREVLKNIMKNGLPS